MQKKLRVIVKKSKYKDIMGLTVPENIAVFFPNTYFNCYRSGTSIVFESGTHINPTKQDVINYQFEDVRIQA